MEAANGAMLWRYDTGGTHREREAFTGIWGDPWLHDQVIYGASQAGAIHAVNMGGYGLLRSRTYICRCYGPFSVVFPKRIEK